MGYTIKKIKKSVNGTETIFTPFTDDTLKTTDVINNLTSTATDKALSANQGRELDYKISQLASIGRFLSYWNVQTGLPDSPPGTIPYAYKSGDFYRVKGVVDPGEPKPTYFKPVGASYDGNPSTTEETSTTIANEMLYYYDGNTWSLNGTVTKKVMFSEIIGDPLLNAELKDVFDTKLTHLGPEAGSGEPYHFPFNVTGITQEANDIKVDFDTLTLDGTNTITSYNFTLPLADPANDKAGLWNKSLSEIVDVECYYIVGTGIRGSVTDEQYAKIAAGAPIRATVKMDDASGVTLSVAIGSPYYTTYPTAMVAVVVFDENTTETKLSMSYLTIADTPGAHAITGVTGSVGHKLDVLDSAISGARNIQGLVIDDTQFNFDIDKTGLATVDQLGDGTVTKLGTSTIGSTTKPIYWYNGQPTECDYTLADACAKGVETSISSSSTDDVVPTSKAVWDEVSTKSVVSVSASGTATDEVQYITVDGTEYKLPSGGGASGITGIQMNGSAVTVTGGVADLGTVITAHQDISGKLDANAAITGGEYCKITFDEKGLVTAGTALIESDIPTLEISKINGLQTALDGKQASLSTAQMSAANSGIDATKVSTYDGYATEIAGKSTVGVAATGTSTNVINYILLNGTEYKIGGGSATINWGSIGGSLDNQTDLKSALDSKSSVGVTATGTSTSDINYITLDGTEYRIAGLTGVKMNGAVVTVTDKVADLGTVITAHQDISGKVNKNLDITAGTNCKITYDAKGLVTGGAALEASDIPNLASSKVNAMTGYAIATAASAIATSDSLNEAIAKLEYRLKQLEDAPLVRYATS